MNTLVQKDGVLVSLEDALNNQNATGRPFKTFIGVNTGSKTFSLILSLFEVQEFTQVANEQSSSPFIAQRKLDMGHAKEIAKYILKGLLFATERKYVAYNKALSPQFNEITNTLGKQPYLSIPPLVASFRNCNPNGTNLKVMPLSTVEGETAAFKIFMNTGDILWVVDGQHRRKAIQLIYEFFNYVLTYKKYPAKDSLYPTKEKKDLTPEELQVWADCFEISKACNVTVEVHLGLEVLQERQLFHDLNNLARKVEKSLALYFDNSNVVNQFIKEVLIEDLFDAEGLVIHEQDKINWQDSGSGLTRKDLVAINAILFLNKTNIHGALPANMFGKEEIARQFWAETIKIKDILSTNSKQLTVAAQPVVIKALAKLVFDFCFGKNKEWVTDENKMKLLNGIKDLDFSHDNPIWRYYDLNESEVTEFGLTGLRDFIPSDTEGFNRDLGKYDAHTNVFRFGAKHNDIYPIVGDMIRWKLGLPKRHKEEKANLSI